MNTIDAIIVENIDDGELFPSINLVIDGKIVENPLNYFEFATKLKRIDRIYVFTCSCGEDGCAGWFEGFKVKYRKNTVEWRLIDPKEGERSGIRPFYSFDREEYEMTQRRVFVLITQIIDMKDKLSQEYFDSYGPVVHWDDYDDLTKSHERWVNWTKKYPRDLLTPDRRCA